MRVLSVEARPLHRIPYLNAARRGGTESRALPILAASLDRFPSTLDGILLASDLQGIASDWRAGGVSRLLGEEVADCYVELSAAGAVPAPERTGVVLAGDLYSVPAANKRGGHGDVRDVWRAFSNRFRWVVGVEGNHDGFGSERQRARFEREPGIHLLDGQVVELDGWRFGGVGRVIGRYQKLGRREEGDFLAALDLVLECNPDVVVLHEGPQGRLPDQRGRELIGERLDKSPVPLVVCGHVHWPDPLHPVSEDRAILNVDSRAILLRAAAD